MLRWYSFTLLIGATSWSKTVRVVSLAIFAMGWCVQVSHSNELAKMPQSVGFESESPEIFYANRRELRRKSLPRVVFVPGILGSKIEECRSDNSQCVDVWGTLSSITSSQVDLRIRGDRQYRTDIIDSLLFRSVYGNVIDHIRDRAASFLQDDPDDPLLTVFHYDWRRSTADIAVLLQKAICGVRQTSAKSAPIVIVSHSMGGLVTKIWAARFARQACANGEMPDVSRIFFVATPHLGSPKAIKAIADGYSLLFDEFDWLGRQIGYFETNYLLQSLNRYGVSFQSLYELLPIRSSVWCSAQKPKLGVLPNPVTGERNVPINLFDVDAWKKFDLLRRIGDPPARDSFYEHELAPMLRKAERLLCEIVDFDPGEVAEVFYVVGRKTRPVTYNWFHLRSGKSGGIDHSEGTYGDGTVPVYSAQNSIVSLTRQLIEVDADHVAIISSNKFISMIDDLYLKAVRDADVGVVKNNPKFSSVLSSEIAQTKNWLSVSTDPGLWTKENDRLAIEINRSALQESGMGVSAIAEDALFTQSQLMRANLYALAASITDDSVQRLTWGVESAKALYVAGNYYDARIASVALANRARSELTKNGLAARKVLEAAYSVQGWSYFREGNSEKLKELTINYYADVGLNRRAGRLAEPTFSAALAVNEHQLWMRSKGLDFFANPLLPDVKKWPMVLQ